MKPEAIWSSPLVVDEVNASVQDGCATLASSGTTAEQRYHCLRHGVALADCSYFGKFRFSGAGALEAINRLVLSDVARLPIRRMLASFVLHEDGRAAADAYIINDGNGYTLFTEGMLPSQVLEMCGALPDGVTVTELTRQLALISIDGPFAWELLKELVGVSILGARYLDVVPGLTIGGGATTIYRAGKTGEFGYLLAFQAEQARQALAAIQSAGERFGMLLCESADLELCKLENRVVNMGCEGRAAGNIIELNTRVMVSKHKDDYVGRSAIQKALEGGAARRLIGIRSELSDGKAKPLEIGSEVRYRDTVIGRVVNARYSPTLERWIGVAFLDNAYAYVGLDYELSSGIPVRTTSAPFITNKSILVRPQEDSYFAKTGS